MTYVAYLKELLRFDLSEWSGVGQNEKRNKRLGEERNEHKLNIFHKHFGHDKKSLSCHQMEAARERSMKGFYELTAQKFHNQRA